jgi:hypothetical protein
VGQPVFLQLIGSFPLQKLKTVDSCFINELVDFGSRYFTHMGFGMDPNPIQNFILDNVAYSCKNVLV